MSAQKYQGIYKFPNQKYELADHKGVIEVKQGLL